MSNARTEHFNIITPIHTNIQAQMRKKVFLVGFNNPISESQIKCNLCFGHFLQWIMMIMMIVMMMMRAPFVVVGPLSTVEA